MQRWSKAVRGGGRGGGGRGRGREEGGNHVHVVFHWEEWGAAHSAKDNQVAFI